MFLTTFFIVLVIIVKNLKTNVIMYDTSQKARKVFPVF